MKKLATCAAAITGLIGTSAFAADMGVPAAPPPAPVWNWTGWYAGVNVGASFGSVKTDFNATPVTVVANSIPTPSSFTIPFGFTNREYPDGFMGGGQIGYNWQYSPLIVVGVEADFQGAVEKDDNTFTNNFSVPPTVGLASLTATGTTVLDYSTKIDWFGTVRARIGYVWGNGQVMSYLTGGLAYGEVKINGTSTTSGTITGTTPSPSFSTTHAIGHSNVNTGWVAGYGTEGRLGNSNWTWKVEGLYMGLGTIDDTDAAVCPEGGCKITSVTGGQIVTHTRFNDGILRGGLNYKFY
jgi:outer membrane immunogenic protein